MYTLNLLWLITFSPFLLISRRQILFICISIFSSFPPLSSSFSCFVFVYSLWFLQRYLFLLFELWLWLFSCHPTLNSFFFPLCIVNYCLVYINFLKIIKDKKNFFFAIALTDINFLSAEFLIFFNTNSTHCSLLEKLIEKRKTEQQQKKEKVEDKKGKKLNTWMIYKMISICKEKKEEEKGTKNERTFVFCNRVFFCFIVFFIFFLVFGYFALPTTFFRLNNVIIGSVFCCWSSERWKKWKSVASSIPLKMTPIKKRGSVSKLSVWRWKTIENSQLPHLVFGIAHRSTEQ